MRTREHGRHAGAGLLLSLVLAGCGGGATGAATATAPAATPTPSATTDPTPAPRGPAPLPARRVAPTRLVIPSIGVDVGLDKLHRASGGELEKPPEWQVPGWYAEGAVPGDTGPAVVAGHVDSPSGPAVFWRLRELAAGDPVRVKRSDGTTVTFVVTRNVQFDQARFPSTEVYGPTPGHELRLITCSGIYDHKARRYLSNRVVFAEEESERLTID